VTAIQPRAGALEPSSRAGASSTNWRSGRRCGLRSGVCSMHALPASFRRAAPRHAAGRRDPLGWPALAPVSPCTLPRPRVIESGAVTTCASAHRRSRFQSASHAGVGADPENDTTHALTMSQHCRCGESAEVFASRASQ